MIALVPWRDVPLYWLDSGDSLTDDERVRALSEYRRTGGMYLIVMAEPTGSDSPEECERLSEAGPSADEIDWAGLVDAPDDDPAEEAAYRGDLAYDRQQDDEMRERGEVG